MSKLSSESMDNVHWVHGQCPLNPWSLSSLAGLTGLCPWTHWTLSRVSMDIVQTVHCVHGKCLECTFYRRESPKKTAQNAGRSCAALLNSIENGRLMLMQAKKQTDNGMDLYAEVAHAVLMQSPNQDKKYPQTFILISSYTRLLEIYTQVTISMITWGWSSAIIMILRS